MKLHLDARLALKGFTISAVSALCLAGPVQAATISYYLDQSNVAALPDGNDYLKVTIADGVDGAIDFTVEAQPALLAQTGGHFGIRAFAFNTSYAQALDDSNIVGLPAPYIVRTPVGLRQMDGFGKFEAKVRFVGDGSAAWNAPLTFSIVGVNGDTPSDYVELSSGLAPEGFAPFAARVQYLLDTPNCSPDPNCPWCDPYGLAFVGGGSEVPLPAAAWMFLSGLAGLAARARRRASA